jgi:hypothetical protein
MAPIGFRRPIPSRRECKKHEIGMVQSEVEVQEKARLLFLLHKQARWVEQGRPQGNSQGGG